jgi:hypothetical protein
MDGSIVNVNKFKTDILNRKDCSYKGKSSWDNTHTLLEIIEIAKSMNCQIITRTSPSKNKPGAWYIKAKSEKWSNQQLNELLEKALENKEHSGRELYLLSY